MLNIVIPMAGAGSRFVKAGYVDPKPLIPVHSIPMIRLVIGNITPSCPHRFIFIAQNSHLERYDLPGKLETWTKGCSIIGIDGLTAGAACTVLKAKSLINTEEPLMIANSDQYVDISIDAYLSHGTEKDGQIMTMSADDPKWSFIDTDDQGNVTRLVEKEVISSEATVGIYNFAHGRDFVRAAEAMIEKNLRVNNEFYVAPAYNQLIREGKKIGWFNIGCVDNGMHGLGTPADLTRFLRLPFSQQAVEKAVCIS